ncbi:MAG: glycoside hydrolase family 16 protein [Bacteroidetes bacterium]|nr:glycoside hydrolase family 16 protein [Bacteroidota bacterium]
MSNLFYKYFLVLIGFPFALTSQIMWQFTPDTVVTWNYTSGDEFNGNSINKEMWLDWFGWGRSILSNNEQQYYSKWKNHFLNNGLLTLTAKKESLVEKHIDWMGENDSIFEGKIFRGLNKRSYNYTAGLIQSQKDFLYGYFEIKFKVSDEQGFWPAFWLYGGTPNEEIDWMELKTEKQNQLHIAIHTPNPNDEKINSLFGKKPWGGWLKFKGSLNKGYNVISGEWAPGYLKYYLNGECVGVKIISMSVPKKLAANIAVASNNGAFNPGPKKTFADSVNFEIDYIRVWSNQSKKEINLSKTNYVEEPIDGVRSIASSNIVNPSKANYANKLLPLKEELHISLMPQSFSKFQLTVLGKNIPTSATYYLKNTSGKIILRQNLKYGTTTLDLINYKSEKIYFHVSAFGKTKEFWFLVN